jgi:adenylosuccinate synthase
VERTGRGRKISKNLGELREKVLPPSTRALLIANSPELLARQRFGFTRTSPPRTLRAGVFNSACVRSSRCTSWRLQVVDTKVGNHVFLTRDAGTPLSVKLRNSNTHSTGRQRMVGWFDAVERAMPALIRLRRHDGEQAGRAFYRGMDRRELLVCTPTSTKRANIVRHAPATGRCSEAPARVPQLPDGGDISGVRHFHVSARQREALRSAMVKATHEVCLRATSGRSSPQPRYVGVGPLPSQIIRDIPPTRELIGLA